MSLLDSYRRQEQQKKKELSDLKNKVSKKQQEIAKISKKIQRAKDSIARTKNDSTLKNKTKEIERTE